MQRSPLSLPALLLGALLCAGTATLARADGIPTAVGVDHIGLTVPDRAAAVKFFTGVLGCVEVYTAGPFSDPKGDWMQSNLDVDPKASTTLTMVRCGPTQNVELFEYHGPNEKMQPPKNSDVGGSHIAFYVKDITQAVAYLKAQPGVKVLGTPTPVSEQPNGGEIFVYFQTPWGQTMELLTYNKGLDYQKTTTARLYSVDH
jgi:catechol 2,3-dioxygenase-like lactoylglutathione lyase family enzyme